MFSSAHAGLSYPQHNYFLNRPHCLGKVTGYELRDQSSIAASRSSTYVQETYVSSQTHAGSAGILETPSPEEKKRPQGNLATHFHLGLIALPPFRAEKA